jgi:four helix bundle protein
MVNERRGADLASRTKSFALLVISAYTQLPKSTLHQILGRQLLRAATSAGAQYREAMRAKSVADFVSKIEGALQELSETQYWLELLDAVQPTNNVSGLMDECEELSAILVASVKTAKRRVARRYGNAH